MCGAIILTRRTTLISSIRRLKFCTFKLNALLDFTNAINNNLPVHDLLAKYENLLLHELNMGKVAVFAYTNEWKIMLEAGSVNDDVSNISVEDDLLTLEDITTTPSTENEHLYAYDFIIPVFHDTKPIAYVLIGDVEEEQEGVSPTIKHLHFVQTLTNVIFVAIENKRLYNESLKQERIKKEMELASRMQSMLVPDSNMFPKNNYISLDSFYLPHFDVGGDYYDWEQLSENSFFFCIADVSGKGISAALLMANFQASLKAYLHTGIDLTNLIRNLNVRVIDSAQGEKFITFFAGKYNYITRELKYIKHIVNLMEKYNKPVYGVSLMADENDQTVYRVAGGRYKGLFFQTPERAVKAFAKMYEYQCFLMKE